MILQISEPRCQKVTWPDLYPNECPAGETTPRTTNCMSASLSFPEPLLNLSTTNLSLAFPTKTQFRLSGGRG